MPLQGAIVACFGGDGGPTLAAWTWCLGAIAGCHCWVPLWRALVVMVGQLGQIGRGAWVPLLQGAIAGCHCRVPLWRALVVMVGQLWQIGRGTRMPLQGAIAGCHCGVLWW